MNRFSIRGLFEFIGVMALAMSAWRSSNLEDYRDELAHAWDDGYCRGRYDEDVVQWYPWPPKYPKGQPFENPYRGGTVRNKGPATFDERTIPGWSNQIAGREKLTRILEADGICVHCGNRHEPGERCDFSAQPKEPGNE